MGSPSTCHRDPASKIGNDVLAAGRPAWRRYLRRPEASAQVTARTRRGPGLAQAEGLRDVVIRADIEGPRYPVAFGGFAPVSMMIGTLDVFRPARA